MKLNGFLSLAKTDAEYFNEKQSKFELLGCPFGGNTCQKHLAVINKNYLDSSRHQRDKNYQRAIELLKNAYYKTDELQKATCLKCADLFRSTITSSLEDIHGQLHKMSTGIFRNKRYHDIYIEAGNLLKEIKEG
jgi:hypothetical protein